MAISITKWSSVNPTHVKRKPNGHAAQNIFSILHQLLTQFAKLMLQNN
jgi:hypothetical protein